MFLIVVGRGSMGKIVEECAGSDDALISFRGVI